MLLSERLLLVVSGKSTLSYFEVARFRLSSEAG